MWNNKNKRYTWDSISKSTAKMLADNDRVLEEHGSVCESLQDNMRYTIEG